MVQLASTQIIDLSPTEEELWHDVYKSSRRYANGARKKGCYVKEEGEAALPVFYDILAETARRSGFIPRAIEAYADVYRAFARTATPASSSATCPMARRSRAR